MPLSVLEAMACNLPVVATRFAGLVEAFPQGSGLELVADAREIPARVEAALGRQAQPATRELVLRFSWQSVTDVLQTHYDGLVKS